MLQGLFGEIPVRNKPCNGVIPALKFLTNQEVDLTYVRQRFGNLEGIITFRNVGKPRSERAKKQVKNRTIAMSNRRLFLQTAASALAVTLAAPSFSRQKSKPLLSFSTLGCPRWTLNQILTCAVENGYQGVELRGLQGELDLPKCPEFRTPESIKTTRQLFEDKGVQLVDLGSSAQLHHAEPGKRLAQLDHAKRFIELAGQLNCPHVRVFPDDLPKEQDREKSIELIINGLLELGTFANNSPVSVLLESHGKVVDSALLSRIMTAAKHPHVGLIWDVVNMWSVTKEPPKQVYATLKNYIRHVHLKDLKLLADDRHQYTLFGEGEAPLAEALTALGDGGYKGYYSFEWEKMWHPELAEPEVAFPHFAKAIRKYI